MADPAPIAAHVVRSLEIPECDCRPCWVGEYIDASGKLQTVKLCQSETLAKRAFDEFLEELELPAENIADATLFLPPCEHVLAAGHDVAIDEWSTGLRVYNPDHEDGYEDAPACFGETSALPGSDAKIEDMAQRESMGLSLRHKDDTSFDAVDHVGRIITTHRNGAVCQLGIARSGEDLPARSLYAELLAELEEQAAYSRDAGFARARLGQIDPETLKEIEKEEAEGEVRS